MLARVLERYPHDVRLVYRHFPLISIHDKAALAAQAAEAAGMQGKFWPMHDLLFGRQQDWNALSPAEFQDWLIARSAELGLDQERFEADMLNQETIARIQSAWDRGVAIGLPGTPFLLINGQVWPEQVPITPTSIAAIVELQLLEKRQFTACPPMTIDPSRQYIATLHTEKGDVVIELYADMAPLAVNNFIFLARQGWYDGVTFHRVIPGFIAQAGDPTGTGFGGPGYAFVDEISPELKFDRPGMVGMANSGKDSNGSQFFITYSAAPNLDGNFTLFGRVVAGMQVVEQLTAREPSLDAPPGDKILSVTIEEK